MYVKCLAYDLTLFFNEPQVMYTKLNWKLKNKTMTIFIMEKLIEMSVRLYFKL